jgi:hypothetical protein
VRREPDRRPRRPAVESGGFGVDLVVGVRDARCWVMGENLGILGAPPVFWEGWPVG